MGPTRPDEAMKDEFADAPDWVTGSCSSYWKDPSEAPICAVGSVTGTANPGLARSTAIARARTEIARSLDTKVQALLKDYQSTATGGAAFGKLAADEQYISDTSKQITDTSISGTKLEASWISSSGTYYALVALDLDSFRNAINSDQTLPDSVRAAVVERAQAAFSELAEEIDSASSSTD